jgi:hypothetical protein
MFSYLVSVQDGYMARAAMKVKRVREYQKCCKKLLP